MPPWISEEYEPGLVSVIIPTYNRAHFLAEAVQSVVNQTYENWECIIVDDGSTDNTREVVQEFIDKHGPEKIRYFHQENQGAQVARNRGTRESRGEFIQYLDSDDLLSKNKLPAHVAALQARRTEAVYGYLYRLDHKTIKNMHSPFHNGPVPDNDYLSAELRGWHVSPMVMLLRRDVLIKAGPWEESLEVYQDIAYSLQIAVEGIIPERCAEGGYIWRFHRGARVGALAVSEKRILARKRILETLESNLCSKDIFDKYKKDLACFYVMCSLGIPENLRKLAEMWLERSIRIGPPSKPLGGSPLLRVLWNLVGPRVAIKSINVLSRLKRKLLFRNM